MTCDECRNEIDGFLSGDIADERQGALLSHMASCEACREFLKERRTVRGRAEPPAIPIPAPPRRRLASMSPVVFAAILAVLLIGVVVAMKVRDGAEGWLDKKFWNAADPSDRPTAAGMTEKEVDKFLENLAKDLAAGGPGDEEQGDPKADLQAGVACLDAGDMACATEHLRRATAAGRHTDAGVEARYQLIRAYVKQKRCVEVVLHVAALNGDAPNHPRLGDAFMLNAECYLLEENPAEAARVYTMVTVRFPALREKALAALEKIKGVKEK